jgi:hypothetical protein
MALYPGRLQASVMKIFKAITKLPEARFGKSLGESVEISAAEICGKNISAAEIRVIA